MRVWRVHELGEPRDVLRLEADVAPPEPAAHEVLVEVRAAALNFADGLLCRGRYQEKPELPFTPGAEVAGVVRAVGAQVRDRRVGERVLALPRLGHGGFAELTLAHHRDVFPVPDAMPFPVAAALPVTYQTGHVALVHRARLRPGEVLLVHAGAGGAGSAAIQIGRAVGATVIATAGGVDKVALCRELGAHHAVDYRDDDFVAAVRDLTDGRGADVIYDGVGGDTFDRSTKCVAFEGRIVVIGFSGGRIAEARTNHAMVKNYDVVGVNWGAYRTRDPQRLAAAHADLCTWWADAAVAPLVSQEIPMTDLLEGMDRLAHRATVGKLVLTPSV